jgi:branched-chain amino acid transport system ATP-binding protein
VSLDVSAGEIVSIIGPNGAGKSTLLKAVCGVIPVWQGQVNLDGMRVDNSPPARNVRRGIAFCLQGNRIFDELTVHENLQVGGLHLEKGAFTDRMDRVLAFFPILKERLRQNAGTLSGGEQQMLSLGRALMPEPKLLLLDEPSLGLSPNMIAGTFERIRQIRDETQTAILIVEQKVREVLRISDRVYGVRLGRIAFRGRPDDLSKGDELKKLFL